MDMTLTHHSGRHRLSRRRNLLRSCLTTASMMGVAGAAGFLITANALQSEAAPAPQQPVTAAASPEAIQRSGQVIAASEDSLTTSSPDGRTTTFRITSDTAQIGAPGLKANVVVLGVVRDGVAVATAIADQGAVGPDGPPMDHQLPT